MKQNRREFLIRSGGALTMTALATQMRHFGLVSAMAQKSGDETKTSAVPNDYRALVCIFLLGGNDGFNVETADGSLYNPGEAGWETEFARRVAVVTSTCINCSMESRFSSSGSAPASARAISCAAWPTRA